MKIYDYLGLAQRAGRLASGEQAVQMHLRQKKAALLIIAADAAANTQSKFRSLAQHQKLDFCIYGAKEKLGRAIGKSPRSVLAVLDRGFANSIKSHLRESGPEKS